MVDAPSYILYTELSQEANKEIEIIDKILIKPKLYNKKNFPFSLNKYGYIVTIQDPILLRGQLIAIKKYIIWKNNITEEDLK